MKKSFLTQGALGIYYGLGGVQIRMTHDVIALDVQVFEVFEEKPLGSASIAQVQGVLLGDVDVTFQVARKSQRRSADFTRKRWNLRPFSFLLFDVSVLDDPNDVIHGLLTRMPSFHISKTFATYPAMCVETTHSQECF